ncbi:unnamed protein product [Ixodes pacificus]
MCFWARIGFGQTKRKKIERPSISGSSTKVSIAMSEGACLIRRASTRTPRMYTSLRIGNGSPTKQQSSVCVYQLSAVEVIVVAQRAGTLPLECYVFYSSVFSALSWNSRHPRTESRVVVCETSSTSPEVSVMTDFFFLHTNRGRNFSSFYLGSSWTSRLLCRELK